MARIDLKRRHSDLEDAHGSDRANGLEVNVCGRREVKLSKITQYVRDPSRSFAVISGYSSKLPEEENLERHQELQDLVQRNKYGWIETKGGWRYANGKLGHERSLAVAELPLEMALKLAQLFGQEAILYKDPHGFNLRSSTGDVLKSLNTDKATPLTFDDEKLKDAWSSLLYGARHHRRYSYADEEEELKLESLTELRPPVWVDALIGDTKVKRVKIF